MACGTIPFTRLAGETWKVTPLHITVVMAVISGVGFTYTVNVNGVLAEQSTEVGITVYTAVLIVFVSLRSLP